MFGLQTGGPGKKPNGEDTFDLEKELKSNPEKEKELLLLIEKRIQKIKEMLRTGEESETYQVLGEIFNGYVALLKVITRITQSSSK